jgi:hypothetical protein
MKITRLFAAVVLCATAVASICWAQQTASLPPSAVSPIVGRYITQAFFPSTPVLTITGVDSQRRLSCAFDGFRQRKDISQALKLGWIAPFHYVCGDHAEANAMIIGTLFGSEVILLFSNGTRYHLAFDGRNLVGEYTNPAHPDYNRSVTWTPQSLTGSSTQ